MAESPENRLAILIGGAPTTGKSVVAELLSRHLQIPWISTDQIRGVMRGVARKEDFPEIFNTTDYTAERFLTEFSAEQIAQMEMAQGEPTWVGIKAFLEYGGSWIVEGVNILPHLIARDFKNDPEVRPVFLVDEDADRMRDVVFNRGLWSDADTYSDDVKEKEIEWALLFSHKLKKEVEKHGYPWVEVQKNKDDLQAVLSALKLG
jgi:2-phosphoglycerate kinase